MTSKIYGYARVSSAGQSLDVQREALHAAGCIMVREEKVSGSKLEGRDELQTLMDFMRDGDTLVVTKLDRLARNTLDTLGLIEELSDRGVAFKSLAEPWADTTSPAAKLMLTIFAGVAEFERDRIRERQTEGISRAKALGAYKGRPRSADPLEIRRLRSEGLAPGAIQRQLGVSESTVFRALRGRRA